MPPILLYGDFLRMRGPRISIQGPVKLYMRERITFLKARKLEKIITSLNRPQSPPEDNWARNLRFRAVTRWASNHPFWGHIICFDFFNDVLTQGQNDDDDDYFCVSFEKTTNTHPRPLMENNNHNCETQ